MRHTEREINAAALECALQMLDMEKVHRHTVNQKAGSPHAPEWGRAIVVLGVMFLCAKSVAQQPTKIKVRDVELHYIEQGQGEPLILLHGGQGDYRSWESQIKALSPHYRVISYSRRYHYPNANPLEDDYHSVYTEADDLAGLIHQLRLGRVHLVGTSIGAFTALSLAVERPDLIRSLVLAEPPVHQWLKNTANGDAVYRDFMTKVHNPAATAFQAGDDKGAMEIFVDAFGGTGSFARLPPERLSATMQNSRFFKALTSSADPYPSLSKDKVQSLPMPVLIITGENTIEIHKLVNDELARLLSHAERTAIPNAGHGSARENPGAFNEAVLKFLRPVRDE